MKKNISPLTTGAWKSSAAAVVLALAVAVTARAQQNAAQPAGSPDAVVSAATGTATLPEVVVVGQELNQSLNEIAPSLGATKYTMGQDQINALPLGENEPFNQALLRFPSMAQDSYGQVHLRGEHANLQYRINDVLLPQGISDVFGQTLSMRFIQSMSVITGALPAQFGFSTAGIIDIHTKSGLTLNGGDVSMYGGSYDTVSPSFEFGQTDGRLSMYVEGSYMHNTLGVENPTPNATALHDATSQFMGFANLSYIIDDTSRVTLMLGGNHNSFQIPNNPNQQAAFTLAGTGSFNSANLNENQVEQNYFAILAYQKSVDDFNLQLSGFFQDSNTLFKPDNTGDLIFNGIASRVYRNLISEGGQADASYNLNDWNTIRVGATFTVESTEANSNNLVFPVNAQGVAGTTPETIVNDNSYYGILWGAYLQDELKPVKGLTINFGGRFDGVNGFINEYQFSPRINITYQLFKDTTIHAGYARMFTPPPLEFIPSSSISKFANTTGAPEVTQSSPLQSQRQNYLDAGISQKVLPGFDVSVDGYYKQDNQLLDEGQFGTALIYSPFNYQYGEIYGLETAMNYHNGGFSAYGNVALSNAIGKNVDSAQSLFGAEELKYISNNWVYLDHDQLVTASAGVSYEWMKTLGTVDMIYGSGLRSGFANTQSVPQYVTFNLGIEHTFHVNGCGDLIVRFTVVNIFDSIYQLRDGSGIGVAASQYGARRGFFGTVTWAF